MFLNTPCMTHWLNTFHFRKLFSTLKLFICVTFPFQVQSKSMAYRVLNGLSGTKKSGNNLYATSSSRFMLTISDGKYFQSTELQDSLFINVSQPLISYYFLNFPTKIVRTFYHASFSQLLLVKIALKLPRQEIRQT